MFPICDVQSFLQEEQALVPKVDPLLLEKIPSELALKYKILPLKEDTRLHLLTDRLPGDQTQAVLEERLSTPVAFHLHSKGPVDRLLTFYYRCPRTTSFAESAISIESKDSMPETKLLDSAIESGASDIHIEKSVFFRQKGRFLKQNFTVTPQLIRRIHLLAKLDVNEKYRPEDGHFFYNFRNKIFDIRVSKVESDKESLVLRILNRETLDFHSLGIPSKQLAQLKNITQEQSGLFLIVGPTGSGKTTTACSLLQFLNQPNKKIVTAEDPIEYAIEGICQTNVTPKLSFSKLTRSFLRSDPDILFIGEIRDAETANTAISAALTGHLVISTLHCGGFDECYMRLQELGIREESIRASLLGILEQTLQQDALVPHFNLKKAESE